MEGRTFWPVMFMRGLGRQLGKNDGVGSKLPSLAGLSILTHNDPL
ncbi:MAG: hypothetical protein ACUVTP_01930 [Candidatus Fervidibacter sp.]